jgi:hypothetical protein
MAAFIFKAWQGEATRLPGYNLTLNEEQTGRAVKAILPVLSGTTAAQARRVMGGEASALSDSAKAEIAGALEGYLSQRFNSR